MGCVEFSFRVRGVKSFRLEEVKVVSESGVG